VWVLYGSNSITGPQGQIGDGNSQKVIKVKHGIEPIPFNLIVWRLYRCAGIQKYSAYVSQVNGQ